MAGMEPRPTFGQWLKHAWIDLVTMAAMGALGLGIYMAKPAASRHFAVTFPSNEQVVHPEFAYPLRREMVPIWLAAFLASMVPIAVILLAQIRLRSFWDASNAITGLLHSLIGGAVFQVFLKWLVGGLRPHFLAVCRPDTSNAAGAGFRGLYYTREVCTGDAPEIDDSLESFPSGHTTAAFAGFVFLALYLNARLKVFADRAAPMWKMALLWAPVLGACLIGGALTVDEFHNWWDVLAGAAIGTAMAFSAYRMGFAAVWDWRWNNVPLTREPLMMRGGSWDEHGIAKGPKRGTAAATAERARPGDAMV